MASLKDEPPDESRPDIDLTTPMAPMSLRATAEQTIPNSARTAGAPRSAAPGAEPSPSFSPNQLVSGRYRIVRFVARGGMGEVYEAEDLVLRERLALKTVLPRIAENDTTIQRFKREIHLARKVSHPNVCRIFDIGTSQLGGDAAPIEVTFLTMELLAGETLSDRLRRGRLSTEEALPIVRQMAAGLEAAHEQGIVHRDFKGGNVMLVSDASGKGLRAVVTDFGLARTSQDEPDPGGLADSLTGTGDILGSPAYMAPEQVRGDSVGLAADIYALGIVMYEMVTGHRPFTGDSPLLTAVKRLHQPPPSPRTFLPELDAGWEAAILRCLELDPADRFTRVRDVVLALGGEEVAPGKSVAEAARRRTDEEKAALRRRLALAAAAVALILAVVVADRMRVARKLEQVTQAASVAPAKPAFEIPDPPKVLRRSVAVLGFRNLSGKSEVGWLSTALAEMLGSELAANEKLRLIPGEDVSRMKIELKLPDADSLSKDTLSRVRSNLRTDFVVLGSYLATGERSGGRIRLDLRLQDTSGGEMLASVIGNGTEASIPELISTTAARLREKLDLGKVHPAEAAAVRASLPSTTAAVRAYSEGLARLRAFDALGARDLLVQAVAADPKHALAHSALATAWSALGYDNNSRAQAKLAFHLAGALSREDRLLVEGRYREALKDWSKATEIYQTLWSFAPDNFDYALRLARAQTSAGRGRDALAVVAALRKLPEPARNDPRIDLEEASAAESLGDFRQQRSAAARAAEAGRKSNSLLLVARARVLEARALRSLGELGEARRSAEDAKRIYGEAGERGGVARALGIVATVLRRQGDLDAAKRLNEESLAVGREIGDKSGVASALNSIANVLSDQGNLAGAKKAYEESIAIRNEIGDKSGLAMSLNNIAFVLTDQGDLTGAQKMYERSLALRREIGDKSGVAMSLNSIATILLDRGDFASARKMLEEALALKRAIGDKNGMGESLLNLATTDLELGNLATARKSSEEALSLFREVGEKSSSAYALTTLAEALDAGGNLAGARQKHEEALLIRRETGEKLRVAESELLLAELSITEGRPEDAIGPSRGAIDLFGRESQPEAEAIARAVLARALLALGKAKEALREIERAARLVETSPKRVMRLGILIAAARIRAAQSPAEALAARKSLEALLAEASRSGWLASAFETRLALGEIEMKSGEAAAGRTSLEALERDAKTHGFAHVARRAAAAKQPTAANAVR